MRLGDLDDLKEDFKARLEKAKNWKENAINRGDDEIVIRATATIDFICEVIMTIDNAPTVEPKTDILEQIIAEINTSNRGTCDYYIVDRIEEIINKYQKGGAE